MIGLTSQKSHTIQGRKAKCRTVIGKPAVKIPQPRHRPILFNPADTLSVIEPRIIMNKARRRTIGKQQEKKNNACCF